MTKKEAKNHAIELAKAMMSNVGGNLSIYPNEQIANSVADFIDTLIARLADTDD